MSGLEIRNIRKVYGSQTVVDDVSFQARPGQILGILGPNGAGKTTTIRMIMGITAPDQGEIRYDFKGKRSGKLPTNSIGYLPEERGLYKEARVLEILLFLASLKDVNKQIAKERALEWLAKFELADHVNSKIEELSKGMAQKVQFIASVLHEPELIILDEPFSGLDPVSQDVFKAEIRRLAMNGTAILLSSHQMNIVEELCDQLFLIHKGKKVLYGTLQEIKEQYGNYRVQLSSEKEIPALTHSNLVESRERLSQSKWRLILRDQVTPGRFLSTVKEDAPISEVSVSRLSLHDIFVRIAKGGAYDETDVENR